MGRARKKISKNKKKQHAARRQPEDAALVKAPHSFVIVRGIVGPYVRRLMKNWRMVMSPYTAAKLKMRRSLSVKDYMHNAGCMNVSHMCIFTRGGVNLNFKIMRVPRGPTLTFRVHNYTLAHDVISTIKKPYNRPFLFEHSPLVVCNNFSSDAGKHVQLMASMFQNMFPTINVATVKLSSMKRVVMLDYNSEKGTVEFRHYAIKLVPTEINRGIKKLVTKRVPNLGKFNDMSDMVEKAGLLSESEGEMLDGDYNKVEVKHKQNMGTNKSSIRLIELGPRLTLELIKVESGVCEGEVIYHSIEKKSQEEVDLITSKIAYNKKLKEKRKKQQKQNVKKKLELKEANKKRSLRGMRSSTEKNEKVDDTDEDKDEKDDETDEDEKELKSQIFQKRKKSNNSDSDDDDAVTNKQSSKKKKVVKFKTTIQADTSIKRLKTTKAKNK